ncbi:MAG: hypothetical protein F6J98_14170 [Moorea sp. SIO4G2]|nr:hypothetical protein [Moorena sp. SIO4G2]
MPVAGAKPEIPKSDAARSWGGSAVLGVPPMSDCRGFPHERLHQEKVLNLNPKYPPMLPVVRQELVRYQGNSEEL